MAANFWTSTHAKQLVSREQLLNCSQEDRSRGLTATEVQHLKVFFISFIAEICRGCRLRQRVAATASVFFHRYLLRVPIVHCDPFVVAGGCVYVASKVEETSLQAKLVLHFMSKKCETEKYTIKSLLDMEAQILEKLDFSLVVFSPYKPLSQHLEGLKPKLSENAFKSLAERSWAIMNDSYRTSLCLCYPPFLIALGCLCFAASLSGVGLETWLEDIEADWNTVYDITMDLSAMYEEHRNVINSKETARLLAVLKRDDNSGPAQDKT
eukprot:evm.model.scf_52.17 EVM.evm.TU.scf_52.17   scf_52:150248-153370(+)